MSTRAFRDAASYLFDNDLLVLGNLTAHSVHGDLQLSGNVVWPPNTPMVVPGLTVAGNASVTGLVTGNLTLATGGTGGTLSAPTIVSTGNASVAGALVVSGNVTVAGALANHKYAVVADLALVLEAEWQFF